MRKASSTSGRSTHCTHSGFDMIIADIAEGLSVPSISKDVMSIPSWNVYSESDVNCIFEFCDAFLHDTGGILSSFLMIPKFGLMFYHMNWDTISKFSVSGWELMTCL